MKPLSTISVAIATYNEESNISSCLDSVVDWVDEIVIVDGQSSDKTVQIIKKYPKIKIILTPNVPMFHSMKQQAIDSCKSDWILQLDADEVVTPDLKTEIINILGQNNIKENGFWIKRRNYFLGRFLTKGGAYPDATIRLYKNGKAKLPCISVHEQAQVTGQVGILNSDLEHYSDPNFTRYMMRNNRYTSVIANEFGSLNLPINFFSFINNYFFKPVFRFFQIYIRHRGYIDGFPGFVYAFYSSLVYPSAYTKYWESKQTHRNQTIL